MGKKDKAMPDVSNDRTEAFGNLPNGRVARFVRQDEVVGVPDVVMRRAREFARAVDLDMLRPEHDVVCDELTVKVDRVNGRVTVSGDGIETVTEDYGAWTCYHVMHDPWKRVKA